MKVVELTEDINAGWEALVEAYRAVAHRVEPEIGRLALAGRLEEATALLRMLATFGPALTRVEGYYAEWLRFMGGEDLPPAEGVAITTDSIGPEVAEAPAPFPPKPGKVRVDGKLYPLERVLG